MVPKGLKIAAFILLVGIGVVCAFDLVPQQFKRQVNLDNDPEISLSSRRIQIEEEIQEPYLLFDSEDQEERTLYITNECPVDEWTELGQWTVISKDDSIKLTRVPFEAFRGPSANPRELAGEYKVILSETSDYEDPIKQYEFLPRGKLQFLGILNATLKENVKYYITLQAKDITATPDREAFVRILSYDHPNLNDTILGTFARANTKLSRKDSDLRFDKVNLKLDIEIRPHLHPDPVCKQAHYNYFKKLRERVKF